MATRNKHSCVLRKYSVSSSLPHCGLFWHSAEINPSLSRLHESPSSATGTGMRPSIHWQTGVHFQILRGRGSGPQHSVCRLPGSGQVQCTSWRKSLCHYTIIESTTPCRVTESRSKAAGGKDEGRVRSQRAREAAPGGAGEKAGGTIPQADDQTRGPAGSQSAREAAALT